MSNKRKLTGLSGGGNPQNPSLRDQLTALTGKVALIDFVLGLTLQTFGLRTDIQQHQIW